MSATQTRLPRAQAAELGWELVALLSPYCERIEICGSIRRGRPTVGDIELVAVPLYDVPPVDLFGQATRSPQNLLDERCDWLFEQGSIGKRYDKRGHPRWGSGLKWATYRDVPVDLFAVVGDTSQFGIIQLLRTGSADWSHRFVTRSSIHAFNDKHRDLGPGWMPTDFHIAGGALWHNTLLVETPDEEAVFRAIGRDFVPPELREVP